MDSSDEVDGDSICHIIETLEEALRKKVQEDIQELCGRVHRLETELHVVRHKLEEATAPQECRIL